MLNLAPMGRTPFKVKTARQAHDRPTQLEVKIVESLVQRGSKERGGHAVQDRGSDYSESVPKRRSAARRTTVVAKA